jgi:hypothetical protein
VIEVMMVIKIKFFKLIDDKFRNYHRILFNGDDELADIDELRLNLLFDVLKQSDKKDAVYKIYELLDHWPFDNLYVAFFFNDLILIIKFFYDF